MDVKNAFLNGYISEVKFLKGVGFIFALFMLKTTCSGTHVIGDTSHTPSYDMLDPLVFT